MTQPGLLLDAVAMGLLRKYLVETFGLASARAILTQFGAAQGWRMADAMQDDFGRWRSISKVGATVASSYEAEQHVLHFGLADAPVCWTLCGLASGYLSRSDGEDVFVLEDRCVGRGDAVCHLVGHTREEWGPERAEDLAFFDPARLAERLEASEATIPRAIRDAERALQEHRRRAPAPREVDDPQVIVARSAAMRGLVELARRVGKVDTAALITGESGAGKDRVARLVHDSSARAAGPFVSVRCGARSEAALEIELFGRAADSPSDAPPERPGSFEAAHSGTLVLDDVDQLSPALQLQVLHAMQHHEIRRVGDDRTRPVDVRVLASTCDDLAHAVRIGTFRQDLYYRIDVVELRVPPLRDRRDDILPLARALLAAASRRRKRRAPPLSAATADALLHYGWPGNVRELATAMERASALARGTHVEPRDLGKNHPPGGSPR